MPFENRAQAGQMLADRLDEYRGQHPLVQAILYAIGLHFRDFSQVSEEDVVATLRSARRPRVSTGASA